MNLSDDQALVEPSALDPKTLDIADRWILSRLQNAARDVRQALEQFRFNESAQVLYRFVWSEFCDWYLELVKPRLYAKEDPGAQAAARLVTLHALEAILRLGHPFMPFITEAIWQSLPVPQSGAVHTILNRPFPKPDPAWGDGEAEAVVGLLQVAIGAVRNIRSEMNVPPEKKAKLFVRGNSEKCKIIQKYSVYFDRLANIESVAVHPAGEKPREAATGLAGGIELFVPLEGLIDVKVEKERLGKEIGRIGDLLKGLEGKLSNAEFMKKAPQEVVDKERQKKIDFEEKLAKLGQHLKALG